MTRRLVEGLSSALAAALLLAGCTIGDDPEPTTAASPPVATRSPTTSASPTTGSPQTVDDYYDQALDWSDCGPDGFECATMQAPLDYDEPGGESIGVAVTRLRSTGAAPRVGSLLVNPGGPGASGVDYAQSDDVVSEDILDAFDLVGFDPRGVGASTPVECLSDEAFDTYIELDASPDDAAELTALEEGSEEFAAGCEQSSAELLPHVGTGDVARDVDLLRAVLGDDELYYLGKSYGTFIGSTYADLFPENVGRLVLDGAIDPAQSALDQALDQAAGFDSALGAFAAYCLEITACPLTGSAEDAVAQVSALFDQLDAAPLPTDQDRDLDESLATYGVAVTLYDRESGWPILVQALEQALNGDGTTLLLLSDVYFDRQDGTYASNSNEVNAAINCIDHGAAPSVDEIVADVPLYAERAPVFGPFVAYSALLCTYWPVPAELEPHPVTAPGANPILVVGTTRDPATPYAAAVALADQLESGVLLSYDGDGHTAYGLGAPCVDTAVDTYLITGEPPADDTTC